MTDKPKLEALHGGKPRSDMIHYTFGSSGIVVQGTGKVCSPGFITFTAGGEVVGSLDATFDFTDLDPALHAMAANMIIQRRMNLVISGGVAHQCWPDRYEDPYKDLAAITAPDDWIVRLYNRIPEGWPGLAWRRIISFFWRTP